MHHNVPHSHRQFIFFSAGADHRGVTCLSVVTLGMVTYGLGWLVVASEMLLMGTTTINLFGIC